MNILFLGGVLSILFVAAFTYHAAYIKAPTVGQTPRSAIVEAWVNILIGFSINYIANILIIPLATHGGHMTAASNFWMGWIFTTISIVRQYTIRRWFNDRLHKLVARIGGAA